MATPSVEPAYLSLLRSGELEKRAEIAFSRLSSCTLCAWACRPNRLAGKLGQCRTGVQARVSSYGPHHGEEPALSGLGGSGAIFFAGCNLACQYCQNADISQATTDPEIEPEKLAEMMLQLQDQGCHNINLVSPSHVIAPILAALVIAAENGLHLPLVYNTGGYDSVATLKLLDGVVDIYLPDMKYADERVGLRYSRIPHYPIANQKAVREMHRQVGDLTLDDNGLALRGLLVRHLILPNDLAGTGVIVRFLAKEISKSTVLNLMDQYHPCFNARRFPELNRSITRQEFGVAQELAVKAGLAHILN